MGTMDPLSWAVVLMVIGFGLVVLEVFIPSGGVLGFFSVMAIVASVYFAFQRSTSIGFGFVMASLVGVPVVVGLAFKYWPHTPMGKAFLGELPDESEIRPYDPRRDLVGRLGIAKSKMLPSGSVSVDGRYVDAVSNGSAIEAGQTVIVVEVRGNRVVVRPADDDDLRQQPGIAQDFLETPVEDLGIDSIDDPLA